MKRRGKRRGNRSSNSKNRERQKTDQGITGIEEALARTRQGRALIDEVRRYKKEVSSYVSPQRKGK